MALRSAGSRSTGLMLALLALGGCTRNAMLELDVSIPAQTVQDGRRYAYIEISNEVGRFDEYPFSIQGTVNVDLMDGAQTIPFAVLSADPLSEVRVLVRYCRSQSCVDIEDEQPFQEGVAPGYRFSFERAFYIGAVTSYLLEVPALSAPESSDVTSICRCAVAGCATAIPGVSYCRSSTDVCDRDPAHTHFCE